MLSAAEWLASLIQPVIVIGNGPLDAVRITRAELRNGSIVRINNWRLGGDAGHRCTHWATSAYSGQQAASWIEPRPLACALVPWPADHPLACHRGFDESRTQLLFADTAEHLALLPPLPSGCVPSTGAALLLLLIHHGIDHDRTGFDGCVTGHYWDPDHRHDPAHRAERDPLAAWYTRHRYRRPGVASPAKATP